MSVQLMNACIHGRLSEVESLLKPEGAVLPDPNWCDMNSWTALHHACHNGHSEVVKLLLAHTGINVNWQTRYGDTAIGISCKRGRLEVVCELLKDPRVNVKLADMDGRTPLWHAAYGERVEVIEWLIAARRDLGDLSKKGKDWGEEYTVLEVSKLRNHHEIMRLVERFMTNPERTRHDVQAKLGMLGAVATEVFALTVFLCDGLLQLKPPAAGSTGATAAGAAGGIGGALRFFTLASKLPMELQMILCHRVVGSVEDNILSQDSEAAFKALARVLLPRYSPPKGARFAVEKRKQCVIS